MESFEHPIEDVNTDLPSSARVYDYLLGGAHNFAADRRMAEQLLTVRPSAPQMMQANRAFLRRAVRFMVDNGVRQFLDIGSGIPTVGHVHEIARNTAPEARVVYVDIDPIAVAHSRQILASDPRTVVIQEDARRAEQIVSHPDVQQLIDFGEPLGVLVVALLHFIPDSDNPQGIISDLMRPATAGSYLAISHGTDEESPEMAEGKEIYRRSGIDLTSRSRRDVEAMFAGCDLIDPGVAWVPAWRPDSPGDVGDHPEQLGILAGVGRKRG